MSNQNQIAIPVFLVAGGNVATPTAGESYLGSGNAFNIADRQLGVVNPTGTYIANGDTPADEPRIAIIQGTPNSTNLSNVSVMGQGDKGIVKSPFLTKNNVKHVASNNYQLGRYELDYITGVGTPVANERYALNVTLRRGRTDITHGDLGEVLSVETTYTSGDASALLQDLAMKFNRDHSKYYAGGNGTAPVIALGIGAGGTVIGGLTAQAAATTVQTDAAGTTSLPNSQLMTHSLSTAIGNVAGLSTATIVNMTGAATLTGLLIVVMHDDELEVIDTVPQLAISSRVTLGAVESDVEDLASTITKVSTGSDGVNTGRLVALEFDRRARQVAFSLQTDPVNNEYPLRAPTYVDADAEGYNVVKIELEDQDNHDMTLNKKHVKQIFICLPAAVSNPTATADVGYTVASTQTNTITALNLVLTPWLQATDAVFQGEAAVFA